MLPSMPVAANGDKVLQPENVSHKIALRGVFQEDLPKIWKWLNEYPRANFDDYGPSSFEEFQAHVAKRIEHRELILGALQDGELVGMVAYAAITDRLGTLHGICFSKEVHGTGVAAACVRRLIDKLFQANPRQASQKITAVYFKDNEIVKKFLRKLGFVHEGTFREHTMRNKVPVDMSVVALLKENWRKVED